MPRERKLIQRNSDGRCRTPLYHLRDSKGKAPYCYLDKDGVRAENYLPLILAVVAESSTAQDAQARADAILEAQSMAEAKRIMNRILQKDMVKYEKQSYEDAKDDLLAMGIEEYYLDANPEIIQNHRQTSKRVNKDYLAKHPEKEPEVWGAFFGSETLPDYIRNKNAKKLAESASKERLSDCLTFWKDWKRRTVTEDHLKAYGKVFEAFIALVGNLPVNKIEKKHISTWEMYLAKKQGDRGARWFNEHLIPVGAILGLSQRKAN